MSLSPPCRPPRAVGCAFAVLALAAGFPAWADPAPAFEQLLTQALTAPAAAEADADLAAAEGRLAQAGVRPNPELGLEVENILGRGPFQGVDGAETTLTVSQDLELWGRRGARVGVAQSEREAARWRRDASRLQVAAALAVAYAEAEAAQRRYAPAGHILEGDRRFDVVVRLADDLRNDPAVMAQLPVMPEAAEPGALTVPLSAVARFEVTEGPNQISRENGKRRIVVQANVRGRDLGGFVNEARAAVGREVRPPVSGWFDWGGQFENLERASARLAMIVPLVFLTIGLLLFLALRSLKDAALVFAGVPLALVGGAVALLLRGMPFSISAAVGFIAVSGVATLNGLVLMQAIRQRYEEGAAPLTAAVEGAVSRLRAVLTTALVAMLGFIPMAFAFGAGAEPIGGTMIVLAVVAAVVNLICLQLLRRLDGDDVNLRAAETFSLNDFASNGGIIVAGGLVLWLDQSWPDLVVGVIVAGIAARGGLEILEDARKAQAEAAD